MDIMHIEPFLEATVGVFRDLFGEEPECLNPYLLGRADKHEWEMSGIIGIAGDSKGVIVVSFARSLAKSLTAILTGAAEVSEDDMIDAVGEIVNIVAGNAKKGLEQYRLNISLPTIVSGKDHAIAWPADTPIVGIPFKLSNGKFHLAVGLQDIITA